MEKQYMSHEEVTQLLKDGYDMQGYRGKEQPKWHEKIYRKWRSMWIRCYDPTHNDYPNYKHVIIADEFKIFSNYVKWIESQPRFEEFCSTCDKILWSIDKDKNGGHYFPHMMILTTQSENTKEMLGRCGNPTSKHPIIGVSSHKILLFTTEIEVRSKSFDAGAVGRCCKKTWQKRKNIYKGYKWYYINYKHGRRLRYANH